MSSGLSLWQISPAKNDREYWQKLMPEAVAQYEHQVWRLLSLQAQRCMCGSLVCGRSYATRSQCALEHEHRNQVGR